MNLLIPIQLVIFNLFASNHNPTAFDRPDDFLPERWLDGRKGRTDMPGEGGDKLGNSRTSPLSHHVAMVN